MRLLLSPAVQGLPGPTYAKRYSRTILAHCISCILLLKPGSLEQQLDVSTKSYHKKIIVAKIYKYYSKEL